MRFIGLRAATVIAATLFSLGAAAQQATYSRAKIYLNNGSIEQLEQLGVCADHGTHKEGSFFIGEFSNTELETIENAGFSFDVVIPDMKTFYHQRYATDPGISSEDDFQRGGDPCGANGGGSNTTYPTPANWNLGSMGGFLTYSEIMSELDDMATLYPNIISPRAPISNFTTHDGNAIQWLKISDNPGIDEAEPELMYTSLIHAREPASMASVIFYMWYVLENYGTDPEVTYLVDHTEMYFVPVINPDGYLYNEQTDPSGGGLWRKNRRNNGSGCFGVDLNRNFSYEFGSSGTSNDPCNQTYLGTNAFSEPESQAIKWFCEEHDFGLALNYHSYGDLLLFPFGWSSIQTPDYDLQMAWSARMVSESGHTNMLSADLYPAAGDTDDWMYADDLGTKPKVLAFTPEVGSNNQNFWPQQGQITGIAENLVHQNLQAAWLVTDFAIAADASPLVIGTQSGNLDYDLTRMGLVDNGTFTVTATPVGFGLATVGPPVVHNPINLMETQAGQFSYTIAPSLLPGQEFQYELAVDNGAYVLRDTITKTYAGASTILFADNGDNTNNWNGNWGVSTSVFYTPTGSITDSPNGDYADSDVNNLDLANPIDLSNSIVASLSFWTRWDIEDGWDYAQVLASTNGTNNWTALCGNYTTLGNGNQHSGEPLYDGTQTTWVKEEMNLSDYLGQTVYLRFRMVSDQAVNEDGFYFDDLEVNTVESNSIGEIDNDFYVSQNMPNPAAGYTIVNYRLPVSSDHATILVHNAMGQLISSEALNVLDSHHRLNTGALSSGVYLYTVETASGLSITRRFSVAR
jgi:carboxypeptidase T